MSGGHIAVGVAGHVDHGKTLLTAALTGVATDRLPEEKRRGMTIVPGYAPFPLAGGRQLALIDVPGHERFVKNMLAGVAGVDMALLVVAADAGVMPQTVEHLNILHLLGVTAGVVALTKCDLVPPDAVEQVRAQVEGLLAPTALRGAPIIAVCAHSGWHLEELKALLAQVAGGLPPRTATGPCRIPVDRIFTRPGFGTIATGTLWAGCIRPGERLRLLPGGGEVRVRGIEVHNQPVEMAQAGQRTALNLTGDGGAQLTSGCWLAQPGLLTECYRLDVSLRLLPGAPPLAQRTRIRVFHGTREVLGRVRLLDRTVLERGNTCLCQLELEIPLSPLRGDRLILRTCSPVTTVAGATVLDTAPPRYRLSSPVTMETIGRKAAPGAGAVLLNRLEGQSAPAPLSGLSAEEGAHLSRLVALGEIIPLTVGDVTQYCSAGMEAGWRQRLTTLLGEYHKKYPLRQGIPAVELRQRLFPGCSATQAAALLAHYGAQEILTLCGPLVALYEFHPVPTLRQQRDLDGLLAPFLDHPLTPPRWEAVVATLGIKAPYSGEYLRWLLENGRLVRTGELLFSAPAVAQAEARLRGSFTTFTMAQARDLLGSTRRYTLPLLEYFDRLGHTRREGDSRRFL